MKRALTIFALTVTATFAGVAVTPGVAFAAIDVDIRSTNGGARAVFQSYGEHLYACDLASNGVRAVTIAAWTGNDGVRRQAEVQDADGANGNCAHGNLSIGDGIYLTVWACERNGANGDAVRCVAATGQA